MDTLEWMLWPARWAILTIGLLLQLAALALDMRRGQHPDCAVSAPGGQAPSEGTRATIAVDAHSAAPPDTPSSPDATRRPPSETPSAPASRTVPAPHGPRLLRIAMLTGGGLVAVFALLERDMLLLAGQVLAMPLLWPRLR
uniref:Uncharacterized protein n=1 Tax=Nitratidesulfovibrio vulgaris (strain DSM 19637 / Miyazaki F) TaxID=883 RepID=B8DL11_NITV9